MVLGREHSRALELTKRHEASVNTIFGLQGGRAPCQATGGPCWHTARADTDMRDVSIGPSLALEVENLVARGYTSLNLRVP